MKLPPAVLVTESGLAPQILTDAPAFCPEPVKPVEAVFEYVVQVALGAVMLREYLYVWLVYGVESIAVSVHEELGSSVHRFTAVPPLKASVGVMLAFIFVGVTVLKSKAAVFEAEASGVCAADLSQLTEMLFVPEEGDGAELKVQV